MKAKISFTLQSLKTKIITKKFIILKMGIKNTSLSNY